MKIKEQSLSGVKPALDSCSKDGLLRYCTGQDRDRPGPTLSLFSKAATFRSQKTCPKCAKFLFLTKFLGCTGITLCNTDSYLNAFFPFFFFVLWMKSGKSLLWQCFLKNNQTRTISIFFTFLYISWYIFFTFFSLFFVSVIWPNNAYMWQQLLSFMSDWLLMSLHILTFASKMHSSGRQ